MTAYDRLMSGATAKTKAVLLDLVEYLPLMIFVYGGRADAGFETRFVWGAATAVVVVPLLLLLRQRLNPLLVAVAVWLGIEALSFLLRIPGLGELLRGLRETAFFIALLVLALPYLAFSDRGLLTVDCGNRALTRAYSLLLLATVVAGLALSVVFRGDELLAATLPATAIFILQLILNARARDAVQQT